MIALDASHRRWVESYAAKAHRRLRSQGCATLQVEDVRQECWIAWCKARDTFDETKGASFTTYLYAGMGLHLRRYREKLLAGARHTVLGDEAVNVAEGLMEVAAPAFDIELRQERQRVLRRMTATTRRVVELLVDPPAWLQDEFRAMHAKMRWCRSRGFVMMETSCFTVVCAFFDLGPAERHRVSAEMARFASARR